MPADPRIVSIINEELARAGAPRMVGEAAFEAALVESGGQNLNYGDRDSLGVFQQRPSQGWGTRAQVTDPRYAARKFITEAMKAYQPGRFKTSGQLAQAVQRSAFPGRYDQQDAAAGSLLGDMRSGSTAAAPVSSGQRPASADPAAPQLPGGSASDFTGLLGSLLTRPEPQPVPSSMVAPPAFTGPNLPQGFQPATVLSPQPVPAQDRVGAALGLVEAMRGPEATSGPGQASEGAEGAQTPPIAETVVASRQPVSNAPGNVQLPKSGKNPWGVLEQAGRSGLYLQQKFGIETIGGYRANDPYPDHPSRKALDLMVGNDSKKGSAIAQELTRNYKQHGVKYLIWNQRIWHPGKGWRKMEDRGSPTQNHKDHVHVLYA